MQWDDDATQVKSIEERTQTPQWVLGREEEGRYFRREKVGQNHSSLMPGERRHLFSAGVGVGIGIGGIGVDVNEIMPLDYFA